MKALTENPLQTLSVSHCMSFRSATVCPLCLCPLGQFASKRALCNRACRPPASAQGPRSLCEGKGAHKDGTHKVRTRYAQGTHKVRTRHAQGTHKVIRAQGQETSKCTRLNPIYRFLTLCEIETHKARTRPARIWFGNKDPGKLPYRAIQRPT